MSNSRNIWLVFTLCALVVLTAMAWLTSRTLEADRRRHQAERDAYREQNVRLALWRMDTMLAPLIAEETTRPQHFYRPMQFVNGPSQPGALSPLIRQPTNVLLNFEADTIGNWVSPQSPQSPDLQKLATATGITAEHLQDNRKRLDQLAANVDPQELLQQLPVQGNTLALPPQLSWIPNTTDAAGLSGDPTDEPSDESRGRAEQEFGANDSQTQQANQQIALPQYKGKGKSKGGEEDYAQRSQRYQKQAEQQLNKRLQNRQYGNQQYANAAPEFQQNSPEADALGDFFDDPFGQSAMPNDATDAEVIESIARPLWLEDRLVLARRVQRHGTPVIQGSWLDWPKIKSELIAEVADLYPRADLLPRSDPELGDPSRMLAGLPVEFILPAAKDIYLPPKSLLWSLGLSWASLLAALTAVGALLAGVLALSQRREAFVSSVTHELRTPLTTFRMYSEMLAGGMVPEAERRQEYLDTLKVESERLSHLVENVLSYARLERGRAPVRDDHTTPAALIHRIEKRLADRAGLAGMNLEVDLPTELADTPLLTDLGVVEQILFNLVDNAAKYAATAEDRTIELTITATAQRPGSRGLTVRRSQRHQTNSPQTLNITIRDHGPGYSDPRRAHLSPAFSKSAQAAADTALGVGLGLSLCRRLAKQLDGKLTLDNHPNGGAQATLSLPLAG